MWVSKLFELKVVLFWELYFQQNKSIMDTIDIKLL